MNTTSKFSSGNDDWFDDNRRGVIAERQELIDKAKAGCIRAKATLMNYPHHISKLTLDGKEII